LPNGKKDFYAVDMMQTIRARLSKKIEGKTLEEEIRWLESRELGDPFLQRLREKAGQPAAISSSLSKP